MDKIIRITLGLLLVILIGFVSLVSFQLYVEHAYRSSLTGTYTYTCTITTGSPLTNVTLFIPVPADPGGNSPVVAGFSAGTIGGIPAGWNVTLYDTGKATLAKITVPSITLPEGTGPAQPLVIRMSADLRSATAIDTRDPVNNSAMFRPVGSPGQVSCAPGPAGPVCHRYVTSLYADYQAAPDASVTISATLVGRNSWYIFGPGTNEYDTAVSLQMVGPHQGWATMSGTLTDHIGMYDVPGNPA
jgi:hypothetical protein